MSGFFVEFKKDNYNVEYLRGLGLGLNEQQIKAVLFAKERGVITNSDYQKINAIGKTFATKELQSLVGKNLLKQAGFKGCGSKYVIAF